MSENKVYNDHFLQQVVLVVTMKTKQILVRILWLKFRRCSEEKKNYNKEDVWYFFKKYKFFFPYLRFGLSLRKDKTMFMFENDWMKR